MSAPVTIGSINTRPELDPYHADTGGQSYTEVWIDPQERRAMVSQQWHTNSTTMDIWHRRTLTTGLGNMSDQDARELLESDEVQRLLAIICDGHSIEWDGHNQVGQLTDEAEEALDDLRQMLEEDDREYWTTWDIGDWLDACEGNFSNFVDGLTDIADATDDQLTELAAAIDQDANAENVVLLYKYDTEDYLRRLRERQRGEREDAAFFSEE